MSAATPAGLAMRGVRKSFGRNEVLAGIDLEVPRGQLLALLGPSGSGKTTLLRLVCGFEHADAGDIDVDGLACCRGRDLHVPPERRGVGYVAQEGALFPHLSVQENVLFGLSGRRRVRGRAARTRLAGDWLERVGLGAGYAGRMPATLSGGEQQRVALARALAPGPGVVLLDEPFSALDASLRAETRQAVVASLKSVAATALLVTHDQDEALSLGDEVALLDHGRIAQRASPQQLYRVPADPRIARFVGDAVLVTGRADGGTVDCCFGRLPVRGPTETGRGKVEVLVRPEQFCLSVPAGNGVPASAGALTASVVHLRFYGHDARVGLRLPEGFEFTATVPGYDLPAIGADVCVRVAGPVVVYPTRT